MVTIVQIIQIIIIKIKIATTIMRVTVIRYTPNFHCL